jgi:hypothetical protein
MLLVMVVKKRREITGAVSVVDSKTLEILKLNLKSFYKEQFSGECYTQSGSPGAIRY